MDPLPSSLEFFARQKNSTAPAINLDSTGRTGTQTYDTWLTENSNFIAWRKYVDAFRYQKDTII